MTYAIEVIDDPGILITITNMILDYVSIRIIIHILVMVLVSLLGKLRHKIIKIKRLKLVQRFI